MNNLTLTFSIAPINILYYMAFVTMIKGLKETSGLKSETKIQAKTQFTKSQQKAVYRLKNLSKELVQNSFKIEIHSPTLIIPFE